MSSNLKLEQLLCYENQLISLNVKNGNNLFNSLIVNSLGSPNLNCIQIDDEVTANNNQFPYVIWQVDSGVVFSALSKRAKSGQAA